MDRRRVARLAPLALGTSFLAYRSIAAVYAKLGHPGAALDDAYIHFQYARAIAEGHPLRFQAGEPISTGATSFLWPALLSPFYLVGFRGEAILWPAWLLSFAALGALAYEVYRLALPLTSRGPAAGAAAMTLGFGGLVWGAGSGMEVVPFAWLIAFATRRAAEWAEEEDARTTRALRVLVALAFALPLMRPEGALTSLALGAIVGLSGSRGLCPLELSRRGRSREDALAAPGPSRGSSLLRKLLWKLRGRTPALVFVLAAIFPQLLLLVLTGAATTSTAQVKLLFGNPYYELWPTAFGNMRVLVVQILNGDVWSTEFLPKGGAAVACLGLVALGWRGHATGRVARAALVLLFAFMMFVPCFYVTFLWNRLRYLWPFAPGWFVGLACLAHAASSVVLRVDRRWAPATATLLAGVFAGMFAMRLEWVIDDVAQSASGIDRQQVALGRWAKTGLPDGARIGVNDTGAIAYFSDKKTFDVVGLTTPTEGRYWVAGQGSRFEHYERLQKTAPSSLPTHFIVYPEWMQCPTVLGPSLHEAVVTDSSILGGQTMRVYEARWTYLDSGSAPWTKLARIDDAVDVADLESEKEHGWVLGFAREGDQSVEEGNAPDGAVVVDGGRKSRIHDRFRVTLAPGGKLVVVARVSAAEGADLTFKIEDRTIGTAKVEDGPWTEVAVAIPDDLRGTVNVEVTSERWYSAFHYWFGEEAAP
ncbi:MAG: hypothetical protein KIT84_02330 [Labilithrix sp.]|nr:hypothetical protein [Labilithrix sp.]MCW5809822.1 hypothetical protein [Labilithrix sp.]